MRYVRTARRNVPYEPQDKDRKSHSQHPPPRFTLAQTVSARTSSPYSPRAPTTQGSPRHLLPCPLSAVKHHSPTPQLHCPYSRPPESRSLTGSPQDSLSPRSPKGCGFRGRQPTEHRDTLMQDSSPDTHGGPTVPGGTGSAMHPIPQGSTSLN